MKLAKNVPPISLSRGTPSRDLFLETGAQEIARRIRKKWAVQGWKVNVWVEPMQVPDSAQAKEGKTRKIYIVRSDMINGVPRERVN
jgi:hypothetical protein